MSVDRAELIKRRIFDVLGTIDGVRIVDGQKSVFRNRGGITPEYEPALLLLDGVEQTRSGNAPHSRPSFANMYLIPQIWILLQRKETAENDEVGEELSAWRVRVLRALFSDGLLWEYMGGDSGTIEYRGYVTDMQNGFTLDGSMMLDLAFGYVFDPSEIT